MDRRFRYSVLIIGLIAAPSLAAQTSAALPDGVTSEMVAQGKKLFTGAGMCLACHGPTGTGGIGPDLTDSVTLHPAILTFEGLVRTITTGFDIETSESGQIMPPRGGSTLKDPDVRAVAAYVWTLSRGATVR